MISIRNPASSGSANTLKPRPKRVQRSKRIRKFKQHFYSLPEGTPAAFEISGNWSWTGHRDTRPGIWPPLVHIRKAGTRMDNTNKTDFKPVERKYSNAVRGAVARMTAESTKKENSGQ